MSLRKNRQAQLSCCAAEAQHAALLRPTRHLDGSCPASALHRIARGDISEITTSGNWQLTMQLERHDEDMIESLLTQMK